MKKKLPRYRTPPIYKDEGKRKLIRKIKTGCALHEETIKQLNKIVKKTKKSRSNVIDQILQENIEKYL